MQFVIVSDSNASYFVTSDLTMPVFRDPSAGRTAWSAFKQGAPKHTTFVYRSDGTLVREWYSATPSQFAADIGAVVRALPK